MIVALPTARGWLLTLLAAGAVAVALVNVGLASAMAATAFCSIWLASLLMAQFSLWGIRVERLPNTAGYSGSELVLPLRVENRMIFYRQPLVLIEKCKFAPDGVLRWALEPLRPREVRTVERVCPVVRRGAFELSTLLVVGGDPAGLFRRRRKIRLPGEVTIYPRIVALDSIHLPKRGSRTSSFDGRPLGQSGLGQEFFGLRPYRPGDEIRFIHWKGTAAKGELMIREFEANTVDQVVILLDTRASLIGNDPVENNFEYLISVAATLSAYLREMYCRLMFRAADGRSGELLRLSADAAGIYRLLLHILTLLEPGDQPFEDLLRATIEEAPRGTLIYALTLDISEETAELLETLLDLDCQVRWIAAPKKNFPHVQPDEPRIVYAGRPYPGAERAVKPFEVCFNTTLEEVLRR